MQPRIFNNYIWGTDIKVEEAMQCFKDFLMNFCLRDKKRFTRSQELDIPLEQLEESDCYITEDDLRPYYIYILNEMKQTGDTELDLDCEHLIMYPGSITFYKQLIKFPFELIGVMDVAVGEVFLQECAMQERMDLSDLVFCVRPYNLQETYNLRDLNPWDIDRLVSIRGLLIRTTPVIPDPKTGFFKCLLCQDTLTVEIDRGKIEEPTRCPNRNCNALNTMQLIHNRCTFASKQICKLQETPDSVPDGHTPYSVALNCYDKLVDQAKPGDRVQITGIYRSMPVRLNPRQRTIKPVFRTFIDVLHFRLDSDRIAKDPSAVESNEFIIKNDQSLTLEEEAKLVEISKRIDLYEYLAKSIAPGIYEMSDAKKGILLQLFGGTQKRVENARYRGDVNILLVGDPGVAKSQLLQYVHKIVPRGVYTSGKGSSAVGLTAAVSRDPDTKSLILESGALVLSDGGVCCIDEFDKMSDTTRAVLHEVMEQQTISIAKAGIISTLNARTSILASANPTKSKFDHKLSLVENINLPPSLLSRFDLLFVILDVSSEDYDRKLAKHLIQLYMTDTPQLQTEFLDPKMLRKYISLGKQLNPEISEEAALELVRQYADMRALGSRSFKTVTATTRQLESMIRLSEASARMRLSETVIVDDVLEASRLIREAIRQSATDPITGRINIDLLVSKE